MPGAIAGDIVSSVYEFDNHKSKDFPLFREDSKFTDDTILTIATADALMHNDWITVGAALRPRQLHRRSGDLYVYPKGTLTAVLRTRFDRENTERLLALSIAYSYTVYLYSMLILTGGNRVRSHPDCRKSNRNCSLKR